MKTSWPTEHHLHAALHLVAESGSSVYQQSGGPDLICLLFKSWVVLGLGMSVIGVHDMKF